MERDVGVSGHVGHLHPLGRSSSTVNVGHRLASSSMATRLSIRARAAPRQLWIP